MVKPWKQERVGVFWFIRSRYEGSRKDMLFLVSQVWGMICNNPYADPTVGRLHLIQLCTINGKHQYHIIRSNVSTSNGFKIVGTMIEVVENGYVSSIGFHLCYDSSSTPAPMSDVLCTLFR